MELVYLWVQEYKNIHNQGFNFSPRFECDYDIDKNELTIEENDDYIENFFGENINVTAIVGKNGSGKSSLIELLLILAFKSKVSNFDKNHGLWCILYNKKIKEEFKILTFSKHNLCFKKITTPYGIEYNRYMKDVSERSFFTIHYNFSFEQYSSSFVNLINTHVQIYHGSLYDFDSKPFDTSNAFSFPNKKYNKIDLDKMDNTSVLLMFRTFNENNTLREYFSHLFKNNKLNFIPSSVNTQLEKDKLKEAFANASIAENTVSYVKDLALENLYILFVNIMMSYWDIDIEKNIRHYFLKKESPILKFIRNKHDDLSKKFTRVTIEKLVEAVNNDMANLVVIFKGNILLKQLEQLESLNTSVYNLAKLIDSIHLNKYSNDILINSIIDSDIIINTLPYFPKFIQVDVKSKSNVKFSDFSRGEKNIISFAYSLVYHLPYYIRNTSVNTLNILIDEIENGLNPIWQQKIIEIIHKIISSFDLNNKTINIFVTSHSPFLLSDIPKQNIIFLDKGIKVKGTEKKQTFGANIHTLLSDSFFMDDGFVGEFAKGKIDEVIKYLNGKKVHNIKNDNEAQKLVNIIGEPIVKNQLQRMLDSRRLKKCDEINMIKQSMEAMQKRLDELEK